MSPDYFAQNWKFMRGHLTNIALKFMPYDDAQDSVDETLIALLKALPRLPDESDGSNFKFRVYARWLHRHMMNRVHQKRQKRVVTVGMEYVGEKERMENPAILERGHQDFREEERLRDVREEAEVLLSPLSEQDRRLLIALHLEGYNLRELAEEAGITHQGIALRAKRAKARILLTQEKRP